MDNSSRPAIDASLRPRGSRWSLALRLSISLVLVAYLVAHVHWPRVLEALRELQVEPWLAALGVYLCSQILSSRRWAGLARAVDLHASDGRFLRLYFEGMFFSLCLPTSIGGDVVKAYRLAPSMGQRVLAGCTVLVDRLTGLTALLTLATVALFAQAVKPALGVTATVGLAVWCTALIAARVAFAALGRWSDQLSADGAMGKVFLRLRPYNNKPGVIRTALGWSLIIQVANVLTVAWLGQSIGLDIPLQAYFIAVPAVALMTALPLSINGLGIREGGLAIVLGGYGVSNEMGVTLGLMWFVVVMISGLIGGLAYMFEPSGQGLDRDKAANDRWKSKGVGGESEATLPSPDILVFPGTIPISQHSDAPCVVGADSNQRVDTAHKNYHSPTRAWVWNRWLKRKTPPTSNARESMYLSVVVPVYNERENLQMLYTTLSGVLRSIGKPCEILFVDDGSRDGSSELLRELAAKDQAVKVVELRRNFGQTAAMNAGIQLASGDVIAMLDADMQNDPADIPMMLAKLDEGYDLVHGWRKNRQDAWINRKLPSKIANWIISKVTGFPVNDLGCTLKVVRREIAQEVQLYGEMHRFIPILCHWRGARCAEVVTRHHPRRFGTSKYGISRTFRVILDLITVKYMIGYLASPMRLFGTIGMLCLTLGGATGFATLAMKVWQGADVTGNPLFLLTAFLAIVAIQFFVLGMLGEVNVRTYYESQRSQPYGIRELVNFDVATVRSHGEEQHSRAA